MSYKGIHPTAALLTGPYHKGVRLNTKSLQPYEEKCLCRAERLDKWFPTISYTAAVSLLALLAN